MTVQSVDWPSLLLEYRRTRGLKQSAAAQDFGVSQATISRWESGASEPTVAAKNLLFRTARRDRSPMDTLHWVETFRRMRIPGVVTSSDGRLEAVTEATAEIHGMPAEELEGASIADVFAGDALELAAALMDAQFFSGRVASYEIANWVELRPPFRRGGRPGFFMHYIGWPHFLDDGRIVNVGQGVILSEDAAAEARARLGGALRLVRAD